MSSHQYIVNVEAAICHEDRWLLVRRSEKEEHEGGSLSLVGGKVEDAANNENVLEETLRREIREEVGIEVGAEMQYVKSASFVTAAGKTVVNVIFLCTYLSGEAEPLDSDEISSVHWLTMDEIRNHPDIKSWTRESLELASSNPHFTQRVD